MKSANELFSELLSDDPVISKFKIGDNESRLDNSIN